MTDTIRDFLGGDPVAGTRALRDLVARGDEGEEALFADPIAIPSVQARRRWLRYIATRPATTSQRLLNRVQTVTRWDDQTPCAELLAGLPQTTPVLKALRLWLDSLFAAETPQLHIKETYLSCTAALTAWGAAGGDADLPWQVVTRSSYLWEKLRYAAFCAGCAAAARTGPRHLRAIEDFVTHEYTTDSGLQVLPASNGHSGGQIIDNSDIWAQSYYVFSLWRNAEIVDHVLRYWSRHEHARVRAFGAQILAGIGFRRATKPLIDWLQRESEADVRGSLIGALGRGDTTVAADSLLALFPDRTNEGVQRQLRSAIAEIGWRASDRTAAVKALEHVAEEGDHIATEAMVSLAVLNVRSPQLETALLSTDAYHRLNAALAIGYLGDRDRLDDLVTMRSETTGALEPVYVLASLARLGYPGAAEDLHDALVAASASNSLEGNLYFMRRPLRQAAVTGLEAGGAVSAEAARAWRDEFNGLSPIKPVAVLPVGTSVTVISESSPPTGAARFDVFISHASEDKPGIARPIKDALIAAGITVWFDESEIRIGDSFRQAIDRGLRNCRSAVIILSPTFFRKEWAHRELDALVELETPPTSLRLLPVWYKVDRAAVMAFSPTLGARNAIQADAGFGEMVARIILEVRQK